MAARERERGTRNTLCATVLVATASIVHIDNFKFWRREKTEQKDVF